VKSAADGRSHPGLAGFPTPLRYTHDRLRPMGPARMRRLAACRVIPAPAAWLMTEASKRFVPVPIPAEPGRC
jgi:hypothetical protein